MGQGQSGFGFPGGPGGRGQGQKKQQVSNHIVIEQVFLIV